MMENPLISIVVPCYNQAQYLDECLKSLVKQRYQNWECILINDGSTDDSLSVALKWQEKDKRIRVIDKHNEGQSAARNQGIDLAGGQYITFVDADDWVEETFLDSFLSAPGFAEDKLIVQGLVRVAEDGTRVDYDDIIYLAAGCGNLFNRQILVKNSIKQQSGLKLGEDTLFNLEYLKHANGLAISKGKDYNYRVNHQSVTNTVHVAHIVAFYKALKNVQEQKVFEQDKYVSNFLIRHINTQLKGALAHLLSERELDSNIFDPETIIAIVVYQNEQKQVLLNSASYKFTMRWATPAAKIIFGLKQFFSRNR